MTERDEPTTTPPSETVTTTAAPQTEAEGADNGFAPIPPVEAALDATARQKHHASTALMLSSAALILLVLAVVGGFIGWRHLSAKVESDQTVEQLQDRLARLESQVAQNGTAITALREQPAQAAAGAPSEELARRIAELEQAQAQARDNPAAAQRITELAEENKRLSAEVALLSQSLESLRRSSADASTVLRLTDRVEQAEQAAREANERRQDAQALLLTLSQLREAVNRGDPFGNELAAVLSVAGDDQTVPQAADPLTPFADSGIATRQVLARRFQGLSGDIVRAAVLPEGESWWELTLKRLASVVTVRRSGQPEGNSAAAVVARAEDAIEAGNLALAVDELSKLQGAAAATAQTWIDDARARVRADRALSALSAHALAQAAER